LALEKALYIPPKTQKQALSALVFFYGKVLNTELIIEDWFKPRKLHHLPVVLSTAEVKGILSNLQDPYLTIAQLMYGAGLKLMEAMLNCRGLDNIAMIEGITHMNATLKPHRLSQSIQRKVNC
jgi:site-specific recombinase XerC